ncbi:MAG: helix-turn-helix domain-containing protein [Clostridia bacterium]|nr:helix-turn-helix domain-containing protein [Clostridia bacterium]
MFNKLLFQYEVKKKGFTLKDAAHIMGVDVTTLYRKMNGESDFYRHEIQKLCAEIGFDNPMEIFFAEKIT